MRNKQDYTFYRVHEFAEDLEVCIAENASARHYSEDTMMAFKKLARDIEKVAKCMREVEWLCSRQITEAEFLERVRKV